MNDDWADYREIFGQDPEPWRMALGALRITLLSYPVDVERARHEIESLTRVLNGVDDAH